MTNMSSQRRSQIFYGWYIVFVCGIVACYAWGLGSYGQGVYIRELRELRGWSTSLISSAITMYFLVGAGLSIFVGNIIDRFGSRAVMACGAVAFAAGVAAFPFVTAPWQLFAAYLVMSIGWGSLTVTAISATLVPWFHRRLGLATTFAFTGASAAGIVFAPLYIYFVEQFGFARVTVATSAIVVVTLLPLIAFMRRRPEDVGQFPDGDDHAAQGKAATAERRWSRSEAARTPTFWSVSAAYAIGLFAQGGYMIHQVPFLATRVTANEIAVVVSITTVAGPLGRFLVGPLADRINPRLLYVVVLLTQAVSLCGLGMSASVLALYFWSAVFGLTFGNVITLPALIVRKEFGAPSFGTVMGMVSAIAHAALALGPGFVGLAYDRLHGYGVAFVILAASESLAIAVMLYAYQKSRERSLPAIAAGAVSGQGGSA
jgi:MFS family permease